MSLPGLFTIIAGITLPLGLLAVARFGSARVATFLVSFLAVQCVLNALFDLRTVLFSSAFSTAHTDAVNMARATGIPEIFWAIFWIGVAFLLLSLALRAYSVGKGKPAQPDLPFEDSPLEV